MQKFDSINVIPFIDIMLVLLAIVLTTATFLASGQLDITLPPSSVESGPRQSNVLEIAIDRNEAFFLDGKAKSLEQIERHLLTAPKDVHITLYIDETVAFRSFVTLIEMLKDLALDQVSIITRKNQ